MRKPSSRLSAEARRAQVLESALPVFARRGYVGAGTRELARAAGVTEPILYRHFGSKAGLFEAVLEEVEQRLVASIEAAVAGTRGAAARLRALADALPQMLEDRSDELRVLNVASLAHEAPEILTAASRCARQIGQALAAAFRGSGLRRGVDAGTAGFLLLELGLGASMVRALPVPELQDPAFADRVVEILLRAITR